MTYVYIYMYDYICLYLYTSCRFVQPKSQLSLLIPYSCAPAVKETPVCLCSCTPCEGIHAQVTPPPPPAPWYPAPPQDRVRNCTSPTWRLQKPATDMTMKRKMMMTPTPQADGIPRITSRRNPSIPKPEPHHTTGGRVPSRP